MSRTQLTAAGLIALTLAVTACTTKPASPEAARAAAAPSTAPAVPAPGGDAPTGVAGSLAAARAPATISLNATEVAGLGRIVTDQYGRALYRFDQDTSDPPTSTCDARCTTTRPPALADGTLVVTGLDRDLVGTTPRVDGDRQLTLNGWPLYRYTNDPEGQVQGLTPTWHAITPEGTPTPP